MAGSLFKQGDKMKVMKVMDLISERPVFLDDIESKMVVVKTFSNHDDLTITTKEVLDYPLTHHFKGE